MLRKAKAGTVVLVLLLLGATMSASARHRHRSSGASPGSFDYYLLSLSWSPAFCLQSPGAAQCGGARRFGFIVHGLWPQNERGWPENCDANSRLPDSVAERIFDLMPSRSLIRHEWAAHGTCSGLSPEDFFALVRRAYGSVNVPSTMLRPDAAVEQSPTAIVNEFYRVNPRFPGQSVVATCTAQGAPRLREVHVCFDRELNPRQCSADALREACRSSTVIVPPIR